MEIKWLLDFVSLANTGNFSRSAEERNITQSAFSRRIRSLETWLGADLFDRKSHPITLTDAGIRFLKPARNMIRLADRIQDDFSENKLVQRQQLSLTASTNLAMSFLPEWLNNIEKEFGEFDVKVQTDISGIHDHFEALRTNQSDFLLHYGHGVGALAMDSSKFEQLVVGQDVLIPVSSSALQKERNIELPSKTAIPIPYISPWRTSSIAYVIANRISEKYPDTRLDTRVESSIVGCTKGFVMEGVGIAWLPKTVMVDELNDGTLVQIGDAEFEIPLSIELYRYSSGSNAFAKRFWQLIKNRDQA